MATVAPFLDLSRLSHRLRDQAGPSAAAMPVVDVTLLHDSRASAPLVGASAIDLSRSAAAHDAVILPAGDDPEDPDCPIDPEVAAWVRRRHAQGALAAGIGSGVLALAAAGLLDGKPASIPPRHDRLVRRHFPRIRLAHVAAIVQHGDVLTAGEPSSIFALVVAIARHLHSHGLGERYRRACGIPETAVPGPTPLPQRSNQDLLVAEARAWIVAHMGDDIGTEEVAAAFNVSARTLCRRFDRSLGVTPARYLREARLDAARSMLHRTRFSIEQIAHLVGYRDVAFFRALFRKETGRSPSAYRMGAGA